ncbi:O-antigen ligase family protein [Phycicoccus sp. SLBN-51]|uniref:O-antigen ligase family protein n=1 Tax=Phycicoccus sp. SLBN-51 TaxID=2768447 RepID=UPI00114DB5AE|nr:hypothetical protein FBY26_1543 [Phycicoccus sp. SLBN-51]
MLRIFPWVVAAGGLLLIVLVMRPAWRIPREGNAGLPVRAGQLSVVAVFAVSPMMEATAINRGRTIQLGLIAVVSSLAFLGIMIAVSQRTRIYIPPIVLGPAAVSVVALIVNTAVSPAGNADVFARYLVIVFWVAMALALCVSKVDSAQIWSLLVLAFAVSCLLTALTGEPYRACDIYKCGGFGALFMGPFRSENLMAEFAAIALVAAIGPLRGRLIRIVTATLSLLVLYATVSRTSAAAVVVAAATVFVLRLMRRQSSAWRFRVSGLVVVAVSIAGVLTVLRANPSDFSNRGWFWHQAVQALSGHWWFGRGVDEWSALQQTGYLPPLFPHSQYLLMLFWSGVLGLGLWVLLLLRGTRHMQEHASASGRYGSAFVVLLAVLGITETVWNPLALDARTFLVVAFVGMAADAARQQRMAGVRAELGPSVRAPGRITRVPTL